MDYPIHLFQPSFDVRLPILLFKREFPLAIAFPTFSPLEIAISTSLKMKNICELFRLYQLVLIRSLMRAFHGPLRVLQKAKSFISLAKIRVKWGR
jgi:hypothetical protein